VLYDSKPTISVAMKKLREEEMITTDENGNIELTEKGLLIAEKTYEKHNIIAQMLIKLGVSSKTAYEDSCHIEHCLSDESFDALKKYLNREK
jgi:DtxR family Mn-dependent transcriptional regulator